MYRYRNMYMFKYKNKKVKQSSTEHLKGFTKTKITSEKMCTSLSDFIVMNTRKDIEKKKKISKYFPYGWMWTIYLLKE